MSAAAGERGAEAPLSHSMAPFRRQALLAGTSIALMAVSAAVLWANVHARADELSARHTRSFELADNVRAIALLRERPQQAAEQELPGSDLLERVARSMQVAGLPASALLSSAPQPRRLIPGTQQAEIVQRLTFERVPLPALVRFCDDLTSREPRLRVVTLVIRATHSKGEWNADVDLAIRVVAPV